jgi:hypothetical protein
MSIVFLDTETTGLDERVEDVFEVAIIGRHAEHEFRIRPRRAVVERMHPKAAEVNRYVERTAPRTGWLWDDTDTALDRMRGLLEGVHICGAVPDFDARHLTALYRRFGQEPPRWHYHLIDIEAMAVGYIHGHNGPRCKACGHRTGDHGVHGCAEDDEAAMGGCECPWTGLSLPWDSDDLSRACGVQPPAEEDRHTALGDARWVKRLYEAITAAG